MLVPVLLFALGLVLLIKGGDWFVDGSTGIARQFHLPEILIGATIVSIGTTLPEVMVSATSAVSGHSQIAYGNAIGSIICNTSLISAITIAVAPGKVNRKSMIIPVIFFFVAAAVFCAFSYFSGYFPRALGICFVLYFIFYIAFSAYQMKKNPEMVEEEEEEEQQARTLPMNLLLLVVGAVLIAFGANLLVENGTLIAQALGVPESVIALTFVALGTSLPELVTAITSLVKGHGSLSLGNIIGANLFNIVLVCGASISLAPFGIPTESVLFGHPASLVLDIPVMLAVMLIMTIPPLKTGKLARWQGILLLCIYAAFCIIQFGM